MERTQFSLTFTWGTIADMYTKFDLAKELKTNVFADPAVTSRFEKYIEVDFSDGHQDRLSQIFFDTGSGFNEEESIRVTIYSTASGNVCSKAYIREQLKVHALRIDPVSDEQFFSVKAVRIVNGDKSVILSADEIPIYFEFVNISKWDVANGVLIVSQAQNSDPIWSGTAAFLELYHSVMGEET